MKQVDVGLLIEKIARIEEEAKTILDLILQPGVIIADFPPVEKKIRKKRVRKEKTVTPGPEEPMGRVYQPYIPEEPKRGRRGRKAKYPKPELREGETPV